MPRPFSTPTPEGSSAAAPVIVGRRRGSAFAGFSFGTVVVRVDRKQLAATVRLVATPTLSFIKVTTATQMADSTAPSATVTAPPKPDFLAAHSMTKGTTSSQHFPARYNQCVASRFRGATDQDKAWVVLQDIDSAKSS